MEGATVLYIVVLYSITKACMAFNTDTPVTETTCREMYPVGYNVDPQARFSAPYEIDLSQNTYLPGETIDGNCLFFMELK